MRGRITAAKMIFNGVDIAARTSTYVARGANAVSKAAVYCTNKSADCLHHYARIIGDLEKENKEQQEQLEDKIEKDKTEKSGSDKSSSGSTSHSTVSLTSLDPKSPTPIRVKKRAKSDEVGGSSEILFLKPPGMAELLKAYKSLGLVGEEQNAVLQTLAAAHGMSFGIEGSSGSGKSYAVNLLMELLPKDRVYSMELSSRTAEMYNCDEINQARIIYIPELQKAIRGNPMALEVVKNLTEGRDAVRRVKAGAATLEQRIEGNKSVIYTLATENLTKKDAELTRRFFTLYTDDSEEQTARIMEYLALGQFRTRTAEEKNTINNVRKHIETCMDLSADFVNPFAAYSVADIPKTVEMRSKVKHYLNLVNASARFNYHSRHCADNEIYVSMEDVFNVNNFCNSSLLKGCFDNFDYIKCFLSGSNSMLIHEGEKWYEGWFTKQFNQEHQVSVRDFISGKQAVLVSSDEDKTMGSVNNRNI